MSAKQAYIDAVSRLPESATYPDVLRCLFDAAVERKDRDAAESWARGLIDPHEAEELFTRLPIDEAATVVSGKLAGTAD